MTVKHAHLNFWVTILQLLVTIPYLLPVTTQMLFKIVVWPIDLKNFSGHCSLRKAFPDYQDMEVELQFKRVERDAQDSRS